MADAWNTEDTPMTIQSGGGNGAADPYATVVPEDGSRGRTPPPPANGNSGGYGRRNSRSRSPARGAPPGGGDERHGRGDGVSNNPGNNLHVSGLSSRVDNRELEAAFSKFGKVQKAAVMYDPHTRESRGFGFVTMETGADADAAIAGLNGTDLKGRNITVDKARRGRARTPTPGRYYGPPKRADDYERPYDPRPYDSRYAERGRYEDRYRGYDDRYGPPRHYDDRRYDDRRYDDRREDRRGGGGGGGGGGGRYDDRRYDDRRGGYDDRRY
ncbi:hypothetical protein FS837_010593 [Tulasnella sp. UAMH 9824]|nr:hypothetical protein FS837_010593 [Tulasnella sp. UAMH 9824]